MSENRILTRSICADLVHLSWIETTSWIEGSARECGAVLEDISPRGACLQVEVPVPVNIAATVRHGDPGGRQWSAHCRIKYCTFREIGYFVGIEFADAEAWSRFEFRPEHLLDLCELAGGRDS